MAGDARSNDENAQECPQTLHCENQSLIKYLNAATHLSQIVVVDMDGPNSVSFSHAPTQWFIPINRALTRAYIKSRSDRHSHHE